MTIKNKIKRGFSAGTTLPRKKTCLILIEI